MENIKIPLGPLDSDKIRQLFEELKGKNDEEFHITLSPLVALVLTILVKRGMRDNPFENEVYKFIISAIGSEFSDCPVLLEFFKRVHPSMEVSHV